MNFNFFNKNKKEKTPEFDFLNWIKINIPKSVSTYDEKNLAVKFILDLDNIKGWQESILKINKKLTYKEKEELAESFLVVLNGLVSYAHNMTITLTELISQENELSNELRITIIEYCNKELLGIKSLLSVYQNFASMLLTK